MELSILLVPVLAGYWVLIRTRLLQARIFRLSGYHLFFHAGLVGICLLILSSIVALGLASLPCVKTWLAEYSLFDYMDIIVISGLLALALPPGINRVAPRFVDQEEWAKKQAREYGDLINLLILEAWGAGSMVEITTKNSKSYIGLPEKSDIQVTDQADVVLVPFLSGYRHPKTKRLRITTHYWPTIKKCLEEDGTLSHLSPDDFKIAIPHREIASARLFDSKAFKEFNKILSVNSDVGGRGRGQGDLD